jgi:hypothetical protein
MFGTSSEPGFWELPAAEPIVQATASRLVAMFGLRACYFEPFPFDVQLPRIEPGRIVLPADEPGVVSWSKDVGVELPVRNSGLTIGRFVLVPELPTTGVGFSPSDRVAALSMAARVGGLIAAAMLAETSGSIAPRDPGGDLGVGTSMASRAHRHSVTRHLRRTARRERGDLA